MSQFQSEQGPHCSRPQTESIWTRRYTPFPGLCASDSQPVASIENVLELPCWILSRVSKPAERCMSSRNNKLSQMKSSPSIVRANGRHDVGVRPSDVRSRLGKGFALHRNNSITNIFKTHHQPMNLMSQYWETTKRSSIPSAIRSASSSSGQNRFAPHSPPTFHQRASGAGLRILASAYQHSSRLLTLTAWHLVAYSSC